jgi:transcriptional regulator with XRE-family HTH domain
MMNGTGTRSIVQAIRALLRARGMTYRDLGALIGVSEPTIKRDLGRGNFSLGRLDRICEALGVTVGELVEHGERNDQSITTLDAEQEAALVADPQLLLTAYLVLNNWRFEEILRTYAIDENALVSLLLKLDTLGLIDYRPPYRFRKRTARNFAWRREGAVHAFFVERIMPEFLHDRFADPGDAFHFLAGLLSEASRSLLKQKLDALAEEFDALARSDARLPLEGRYGCSAIVALRQWEYSEFTRLRRGGGEAMPVG